MEIRELNQEEYTAASELLWKSFYWSEKDNVSLAGMEKFRDLTSPVSLSVNAFYESWIFCGCFEERELVAVGAAVEASVGCSVGSASAKSSSETGICSSLEG